MIKGLPFLALSGHGAALFLRLFQLSQRLDALFGQQQGEQLPQAAPGPIGVGRAVQKLLGASHEEHPEQRLFNGGTRRAGAQQLALLERVEGVPEQLADVADRLQMETARGDLVRVPAAAGTRQPPALPVQYRAEEAVQLADGAWGRQLPALFVPPLHDRLKQILLALVVVGQVADADAEGIGDTAHADAVPAHLVEQARGSLKNFGLAFAFHTALPFCCFYFSTGVLQSQSLRPPVKYAMIAGVMNI